MEKPMLIDLTVPVSVETRNQLAGAEPMAAFGHVGTHFDVMNKEFPSDWFERPGLALDVSSIRGRDITSKDVDLSAIREGMFIAFHSGFIDEVPYGTPDYFTEHPQLSDELIEALLDRKASIIGIDFAGVRRGAEHRPKDQLCADRGVFIVENLCNLKTLLSGRPRRTFTAHTYPVHFTGMSGLPCRVAAEI
jgi:kynurenine formamidase